MEAMRALRGPADSPAQLNPTAPGLVFPAHLFTRQFVEKAANQEKNCAEEI
jgi:hypothetical protein